MCYVFPLKNEGGISYVSVMCILYGEPGLRNNVNPVWENLILFVGLINKIIL